MAEEQEGSAVEEIVDEPNFKSAGDDSVIKVDLNKPPTNETEETEADPAGVVGSDEDTGASQEQEEVQPEGEVQETELPVLEEVTDEEVEAVEEQVEIVAHSKGHEYIAHDNSSVFEKSLANSVNKLSIQLKKEHDRMLGH